MNTTKNTKARSRGQMLQKSIERPNDQSQQQQQMFMTEGGKGVASNLANSGITSPNANMASQSVSKRSSYGSASLVIQERQQDSMTQSKDGFFNQTAPRGINVWQLQSPKEQDSNLSGQKQKKQVKLKGVNLSSEL